MKVLGAVVVLSLALVGCASADSNRRVYTVPVLKDSADLPLKTMTEWHAASNKERRRVSTVLAQKLVDKLDSSLNPPRLGIVGDQLQSCLDQLPASDSSVAKMASTCFMFATTMWR